MIEKLSSQFDDPVSQMLPFSLAAVIVLVVLYWRRKLMPTVFEDAPVRRVELSLMDLICGFAVHWVGMVLFVGLLTQLDVVDTESGQFKADATGQAAWSLIGKTATSIPVIAYLFWRLSSQAGWPVQFGLVARKPAREIRAGFLGLIAALPLTFGITAVVVAVGSLLSAPPPPQIGHKMLEEMVVTRQTSAMVLMVVSAVLAAPLFEEIVFRGLMQTSLLSSMKLHRWWVIIFSSIVFAAIHVTSATWHTLPALFVLGMVLGWLYERHGSLVPCFMVHAGFNAINIALAMWAFGPENV